MRHRKTKDQQTVLLAVDSMDPKLVYIVCDLFIITNLCRDKLNSVIVLVIDADCGSNRIVCVSV